MGWSSKTKVSRELLSAIASRNLFNLLKGTMRKDCHAPLFNECPQYHRHKGDARVTPGTCGAIGERALIILVWMRALEHWEHLPPMETRSHKE